MTKKNTLIILLTVLFLSILFSAVNAQEGKPVDLTKLQPYQLVPDLKLYIQDIDAMPHYLNEIFCSGDSVAYAKATQEFAMLIANTEELLGLMGVDKITGYWEVYYVAVHNPDCQMESKLLGWTDRVREKIQIRIENANLVPGGVGGPLGGWNFVGKNKRGIPSYVLGGQ